MMTQTGQQTITIKLLSDISRSKGNQTMKFSQLIEYNIKNIFLEKSSTKCGGVTSPYLLINSPKFHTFCFYFMPKSRTTQTYGS